MASTGKNVVILCLLLMSLGYAEEFKYADGSSALTYQSNGEFGLYNSNVAIIFSDESGNLKFFSKPGIGNIICEKSQRMNHIWQAEILAPDTNKPVSTFPLPKKFSYEFGGNEKSRTLVITYAASACKSIVNVTLGADSEFPKWRINVIPNDPCASVWTVSFPRISYTANLQDSEDNYIVVPYRRGKLMQFGKSSPKYTTEQPYPGPSAKFQFTAVYNKTASSGLYMAAEDGEGYSKSLSESVYPDSVSAVLSFRHFPDNRGRAGISFKMPYDVSAGPYSGDWYDAARIYRQWWTKQTWAGKGLLINRTDIPEWLKNSIIAYRFSTSTPGRTVENNIKNLRFVQQLTGNLPANAIWYAPFDPGKETPDGLMDTGHGHKLPLKTGVTEALAEAAKLNTHVEAYVQSMIYDIRFDPSQAPGSSDAWKYVTRDQYGKEVWYGVDGINYGALAMCRFTEWWQDRLIEIGKSAVESGFDGIYLDSFGKGSPECFCASHGHSIGGGITALAGQRELIARMKKELRRINKDAVFSGEDAVEAFRDLLDTNLYSLNLWQDYIPLYRVIWGDYSLGYSRTMRSEKGNPLPFMGETAVMFLEGTAFGRIFLEGQNIFLAQKEYEIEKNFLVKCTAYANVSLDYLRFGEYLRPLKFDESVPVVEFKATAENSKTKMPGILNSVVRNHKDGSVAVVLVNITDKPLSCKFTAETTWGKNKKSELYLMDQSGNKTKQAKFVQGEEISLTIAPGDIKFYIIK